MYMLPRVRGTLFRIAAEGQGTSTTLADFFGMTGVDRIPKSDSDDALRRT